jgi:chromosomal replication initiation ATPase DnaA
MLVQEICEIIGADYVKIVSPSRYRKYSDVRAVIATYLKEKRHSYKQIAEMLGRSDHTSAMHMCKVYKNVLQYHEMYSAMLEAIKQAKPVGEMKVRFTEAKEEVFTYSALSW